MIAQVGQQGRVGRQLVRVGVIPPGATVNDVEYPCPQACQMHARDVPQTLCNAVRRVLHLGCVLTGHILDDVGASHDVDDRLSNVV